jgi:hypothetical protein
VSAPPPISAEEMRRGVDKFVAMAHNNAHLMKFIQIAVDTFERQGTMQLTLHIKSGAAKGGDGSFSF